MKNGIRCRVVGLEAFIGLASCVLKMYQRIKVQTPPPHQLCFGGFYYLQILPQSTEKSLTILRNSLDIVTFSNDAHIAQKAFLLTMSQVRLPRGTNAG
jgi:hypothetical protein